MTATIKAFNGSVWQTVTGFIVKRYEKGLTIDDERGVRYYATFDRVISADDQAKATLW